MAAKKKTSTKKSTVKAKANAKPASQPKKKASSKKASTKKKVATQKKVSAKKVSAKKVASAPKVSPLRGKSVDEWAAKKLTGWQEDALKLIRALVVRHAPLATLELKWGQPVWEQNGPFAYARPSAKHLTFGFWRGADLDDPSNVLEGDGDRMRHVKITSIEDVSRLPLEAFIKEAVDLNEKKGNPTKREGASPSATAAPSPPPTRMDRKNAPPRSQLHRQGHR